MANSGNPLFQKITSSNPDRPRSAMALIVADSAERYLNGRSTTGSFIRGDREKGTMMGGPGRDRWGDRQQEIGTFWGWRPEIRWGAAAGKVIGRCWAVITTAAMQWDYTGQLCSYAGHQGRRRSIWTTIPGKKRQGAGHDTDGGWRRWSASEREKFKPSALPRVQQVGQTFAENFDRIMGETPARCTQQGSGRGAG